MTSGLHKDLFRLTLMTLDRYGHQLPGAQAEASAVLEKRLGACKTTLWSRQPFGPIR